MNKLSIIRIRILLALYERKKLTQTDIAQRFRTATSEDKQKALGELEKDNLITKELCPKPHAKKIPIYYFITASGTDWVKSYLKKL